MTYTAKIKKQRDGNFLVSFPSLPGCLTEGDTLNEALKNAKEALDGWLAAHVDRHFKAPKQNIPKGLHTYPIEVDAQIAFAIKLRKLRHKRGLTQAQVAKKLKISQQAYAKLEAPLMTNPSLSTITNLSHV